MSVEEEVEFRDLVTQTLEANGCLANIRAQLRASIVLALDEDPEISCRQPLLNNRVKQFLDTAEGRVMFGIVHEFLEFFSLYSTLSVYQAESYFHNNNNYKGREKLIEDLGLTSKDDTNPILFHLIKIAQVHLNGDILNSNVTNLSSAHSDIDKTKTESSIQEEKDSSEVVVMNEQNGNLNSTYCINKLRLSTESTKMNSSESFINGNNSLAEIDEEESISDDRSNNDCKKDAEEEVVRAIEKQKPIQKSDKVKSKNSLSSLSDLPPLQLNRSRGDILPSMYSKELKERTNLKALDKLFDVETEYEEDFSWNGDELSSEFKPLDLGKKMTQVTIQNDASTTSNGKGLSPGLAPDSQREPDPPDLPADGDQTVNSNSKKH
ncbi:unnamed protein product [Callosobruchus maculatus]|uniref:FGFR1 oncogene partner (FOP) N-terminal dimerisation domain-containing protein n=1 Tax=Callosobruchus maculatus TaxID=64391 RepID=A0A653CGU6_CALMS|nr:unnamed protein product [Callosobruchus maculatus]